MEHGARPPVDERVALDPAIVGAARALKIWAEQAAKGSRKIPGHALESLALHCQDSEPSSATMGDGAMQLCVAVLQGVADGGGDAGVLREATRLDKPTRSSLAALAQATLHVFAVSRALLPGGCFRTAAEVRVWLIGSGHLWPLQKTLAGLVPGWLLCTPAQQRAADPTFSILTQGEGTVDGGTEEGSSQLDGMRNRSLVLMLATPLGAYVQAGSRAKSVSDPATSENSERVRRVWRYPASSHNCKTSWKRVRQWQRACCKAVCCGSWAKRHCERPFPQTITSARLGASPPRCAAQSRTATRSAAAHMRSQMLATSATPAALLACCHATLVI